MDATDTQANIKAAISSLAISLGKSYREFPYDTHIECGCGHHTFDGDNSVNSELESL